MTVNCINAVKNHSRCKQALIVLLSEFMCVLCSMCTVFARYLSNGHSPLFTNVCDIRSIFCSRKFSWWLMTSKAMSSKCLDYPMSTIVCHQPIRHRFFELCACIWTIHGKLQFKSFMYNLMSKPVDKCLQNRPRGDHLDQCTRVYWPSKIHFMHRLECK